MSEGLIKRCCCGALNTFKMQAHQADSLVHLAWCIPLTTARTHPITPAAAAGGGGAAAAAAANGGGGGVRTLGRVRSAPSYAGVGATDGEAQALAVNRVVGLCRPGLSLVQGARASPACCRCKRCHTHAQTAPAQTAMFEKGVKTKALLAVDHFNKDYKKGFQFLQVGRCGLNQQPV